MTETPPPAKKAPAVKAATSKAPAAKSATAKTPAAKTPAAKTPAATTPAAKTPAAKTPAAKKPAATAASAPATPVATAPVATTPVTTPPPPAPAPATYGTPAPAPVAHQPMLESDARLWAMLLHILAAVALVLSAGTIAFVVPLVIWLIYRERSALVDHHGKANLNLQLTMLLVLIGGTILGFATLGIGFIVTGPLMLAYGLYALIISIVAGVKANGGEYYKIPVIIPFIR
jgi:uncharacterized Tic20 family protein